MIRRKFFVRLGLVLSVLVMTMVGIGRPASAGDVKVGIINTASILSDSVYGKKLQARFAEEIKSQRQGLDKKRQEVRTDQERLEAARKSGMSEAVLKEITGLLEKNMREFEWLKSDMDKKLKEMDQALLEDMREKVQIILAQYVEDTDYAIIIERSRVAAAGSRVDVTDDIIRLMDRRFR